MRYRQTERRLLRLVFGVVLAFAILLAWGAALRESQNWRVGRAMNGFRADPNGEHAHELIQAIAGKAVTPAQGERILMLLLRPQITTRAAYPAGQPAKMSVRRPLHIEMPQGWIEFEQQVWADGQQIDASRQTSHNILFGFPEILTAWRRAPGAGHVSPGDPHRMPDQARRTKSCPVGAPSCMAPRASPGPARVAFARR